jgi:acyl dehydratase
MNRVVLYLSAFLATPLLGGRIAHRLWRSPVTARLIMTWTLISMSMARHRTIS